jgi:hypothetical protein
MVCSCCVVQRSRAISAAGCTAQKTWRSACAKPGNTVIEAIDITCEDNRMIKTQITLILDSRIFLMR